MLFPIPSPHWCILAGLMIALIFPLPEKTQKLAKLWSGRVLQLSIVLLGTSLNFRIVLSEGPVSLLTTFAGISLIMAMGFLLAKIFRVEAPYANLISAGTAICGGSAIGAVAPIIKADQLVISVSLAVVFILNAVSIFMLPQIGDLVGLTDLQFGTWAALAIHDTSAVVAAASLRSEEALEVATTLKLIRALWIIPLALFFAYRVNSQSRPAIPWFILFFVLASMIFTFAPGLDALVPTLKATSRAGFSLTLFLIGLSLNRSQLRAIKLRPILFAITLWLLTLFGSLLYVKTL